MTIHRLRYIKMFIRNPKELFWHPTGNKIKGLIHSIHIMIYGIDL